MSSIKEVNHRNGAMPAHAFPFFVLRKLPAFIGLSLVLILFLLPLYRLVALSLTSDTAGVTLEHYAAVLSQPSTWTVFLNTVLITGCATLISLVLGIVFAWIVAYTNIRGKRLMHVFILLPFVIPSYITTLAWTQFLGPNSLVAHWLSLLPGDVRPWNLYSYSGMIFILGLTHYPLVYLFTVAVFRKISRETEQAARASGASKWLTFLRVTLPLALPGIAGGGFLAFLASLDNFGIPAFLGIPADIHVLSTFIYQQVIGFGTGAFAKASVLSVLLASLALVGMLIQWWLLKKTKTNETTREDRQPRYLLSRWKRNSLECCAWLFFFVTGMVPFLSMMMTSLVSAYGLSFNLQNISLENYAFVLLENPKTKQALMNSVTLASVTMAVGLIVGTAFAYLRLHRQSKWLAACETLIGLPYALPGTVMALSMIFTWMEPVPGWNPGVYGSMTILFFAYFTRFLILQVRGSMTAVAQVDRSVEEAARVSGTNGWAKWRTILIPLYAPGIMSGAFLVFLTALTELTVSSLLYSAQSETIGVVIFGFEQAGYTTYSTAFSSLIVLLIMIGFASLYLSQTIWNRRVGNDHDR